MVVERYIGALAREDIADGRADAPSAARNKGALTLK
jgi:hypothetical protein